MLDAHGPSYDGPLPRAIALPISYRPVRTILRERMGRLLLTASIIILGSGALYPQLPRSYRATSLVLLQPTDREGQSDTDATSRDALDENAIQTYQDILASHPILAPLVEQHIGDTEFNPALRRTQWWRSLLRHWVPGIPIAQPSTAGDEAAAVEANLRRHLVVARDHKSYALQIGFSSASPDKAADMANALAKTFVADLLARKQHEQHELTAHLEDRVTALLAKARQSDSVVNGYRVASGLIHTGERTAAEHELDALSSELAKATGEAEISADRATTLADMQRQGTIDAAPEVMASAVIQSVKEKMMALNSSASFGGALTVMTDLKTAIGGEAQRIVRAAQTEAAIDRRHADALRAEIDRIDGRLVYWQGAERQLRELRRMADADDAALKAAMAQLRAQTGRAELLRADAEIIAPAIAPLMPSFPNPLLYALGTLMMALLACGLVLYLPDRSVVAAPATRLVEK